MAVLEQIQSAPAIYMGWYGTCETEGCEDFSITSAPIRDKIQKVFQVSSQPKNDGYNAFDGTIDASYDSSIQPFTSLECGKSYIVVLKPGMGSIRIDEFIFTDEDTTDLGRVIETCAYDPTPTPVVTPTPPPEPTPTPVVPTPTPTSVAPPALEFRWKEIGGREVLQVRKILTPFGWQHHLTQDDGLSVGRDTAHGWSTVYACTESDEEWKHSLRGIKQFQGSGFEIVPFADAAVPFDYHSYHGNIGFDGLEFKPKPEEYYATSSDLFRHSRLSPAENHQALSPSNLIISSGRLSGFLDLYESTGDFPVKRDSYSFSIDPSSSESISRVFNFDRKFWDTIPGGRMLASEWCTSRFLGSVNETNQTTVYNTIQQRGAHWELTLRYRANNKEHERYNGEGLFYLGAKYVVGTASDEQGISVSEELKLVEFTLIYRYEQLMLDSHASHTEYAYDESLISHPAPLFLASADNSIDPNVQSSSAAAIDGHPLIRKKIQVPDPTPTPTPVQPDPTPTPTPVQPDPTPTPTPVQPDPTPTPTPVVQPDPTPTPTPVVQPDPTPTPTPEPVVDCCADKDFSVTVVDGQLASDNNVTVSTGGKNTNDSTWDGKMCWEEMTSEGNDTFYWIDLRSSQGSSESLGTVLISLSAKYEGQKFTYVLNSSGICYTGDMLSTDEHSGPNVWTPS